MCALILKKYEQEQFTFEGLPVELRDSSLNAPSVKYFSYPSWADRGDFWYILALGEPVTIQKYGEFWDDTVENEVSKCFDYTFVPILGVIALSKTPDCSDKELWMNYIAVDVNHFGQGIAKQMLSVMVEFLKKEHPGKTLNRTKPSSTAPAFLKGYISNLLDSEGISWTQETN